jgi:hypothetical protein
MSVSLPLLLLARSAFLVSAQRVASRSVNPDFSVMAKQRDIRTQCASNVQNATSAFAF